MAEAQFIPGYGAAQQVNQNLQVAQSMMMRAIDHEKRKQLLPLQVAEAGLKVKAMQNSLAWDEKMKPLKLQEMVNATNLQEFDNANKLALYNKGVIAQKSLPEAWTRLNQATTLDELTNLEAEVSQGAGLAVSAPNFKPHYDSLMQSIKNKRGTLLDKQNEKYRENTINPEQPPEIVAYRKVHTFSSDGAIAYTDEPSDVGYAVINRAQAAVATATTPQEAYAALMVDGYQYLPQEHQKEIRGLVEKKADGLRKEASGGGGRKLDLNQSNLLQFEARATQAESEIANLAGQGYDPGGALNIVQDNIPNLFRAENRQAYRAAAHAWIQAILRKESGAAIPDSELEKYFETYFPQPGDGRAVVEIKNNLRKRELASFREILKTQGLDTLPPVVVERPGAERRGLAGDAQSILEVRKQQEQPSTGHSRNTFR